MLKLAPVEVEVERKGEALYLRSGQVLAPGRECLGDALFAAAAAAPDRVFLAERVHPDDETLREVSYGQALAAAEGIAARLVARSPSPAPLMVLCGNSVDHALLTLGAYLAGVPIAPVSAAYSLMSHDHGKLRHIAAKLKPDLVFVPTREPYARALDAVNEVAGEVQVLTSAELAEWAQPAAADAKAELARAREGVGPDHVAKILFTSGSTGFPKGVLNTHRMLTSNQQMISQLWPFLDDEPPVMVDWLPWSHTFGGNHNFHLALFHAGTLLVDEGKPSPALVGRSIANLRAMPPTLYFNVPAGFAALVPHLERDSDFCARFFSRLRVIFYAGAALPDDLWQRLVALAADYSDELPFMTTAWGSTETSPLSTSAHFPLERAGNIGVPAPGVTLKLVPNGEKQEVRVAGPHVMESYLDEPELSAAAFDEEGYYRIGDAVRLADPSDPSRGLLFDGRVTEDFKLSTGTWVNVGQLRTGLLAACSPALQDLVVAGHDRPGLAILAWPSPSGCRPLCGEELDLPALAGNQALRAHLRQAIARWNAEHPQSSTRITRVLLLDEPPSIDAGEITDKGYVNQRLTLERRRQQVDNSFASEDDDVLRFA